MSDISVGSVSVDVVPDTRGFAEDLRAKLSNISVEIGVTADTSAARAQIDEVARARSATINADADTGAAEAELDAAARPRDAKIHADVGNVSALMAGVVALGPALVPLLAVVGGLGAALAAPLAAAGGGATVFGLIAGKEISNTNKVAKQIADLKKRADTLVDPKASAAAAAQAKALEASLTGPQKAFLAAKQTLSGAFATLTKTSGGAIFRPVVQAMRLLGAIMPQLAPIITSVSSALSEMLKEIGDSAKSGSLKDFLAFIAQMSGPVLTSAGVILGNLAVGFGGLFKAFAPVSGQLTSGLLGLSGAFADFGRNAGSNNALQSFIGYVQQVGPQVAATLGSLVGAIVHIGAALAPLGPIVLSSIKFLADVISAIPMPILGVLAAMIGTVVVGIKLWAIAQGILNAVMDANPIGLVVIAIAALVAGLVYAYKNSETFRNIVNTAFHAVSAAVGFMIDHWKLFITLLLGPFGAAIVFVVDHLNTVKSVARTVFRYIIDSFLNVVGALLHGAAAAFGWVPKIGDKLVGAADAFDRFRDRVNAALDGIHSEKDIHLNVTTKQSVLLSSINKPRVPHGATGGIVTQPTLALIGEAGPEAVVPLNRTAGSSPLPPSASGVDAEQTYFRAMTRALAAAKVTIIPKDNLSSLDLLVGTA